MPRKRRNEVIAGFFILTASALLFLLLVMMGTFQGFLRAEKDVDVVFEDIQGLRRGDPVHFLGRKVGAVRKVDFETIIEAVTTAAGPKNVPMSRVVVTLGIPEESWKLLKTDSRVLVDKTLTGNLMVRIGEGESDRYLKDAEERVRLRGDVFFDFDENFAKLSDSLEKANIILTDLSAILQNVRSVTKEGGHLQSIFADIAPIAKDVRGISEQVRGMIEENREHLRTMVANVAASSQTFRELLESRVGPAAESLEAALAKARDAAAAVDGLVSRNRPRVDHILESLDNSATTAETLIAEIRRRPWRLLYEPDAAEVESLGLYDAAWAYNLTAMALHRSVIELAELAGAGGRADPVAVQRALDEVEASLDRQRQAEARFWELLGGQVAGR